MNENQETADSLRDVLFRHGFVHCDIPACNCGSWHPRYGLIERWQEVEDALCDAGHPPCNENGNLVSRALDALIAERDSLRAKIAQAQNDRVVGDSDSGPLV